jgi:hypothetical protein
MGCANSKYIIQINVVESGQKIFFTREELGAFKTFHQLLVTKNIVFPNSGYRIIAENNVIDPYSSVKVYKNLEIEIFNGVNYRSHCSLEMISLYRR